MDMRNRFKPVVMALAMCFLNACQQDPDTPMKVVMSDESMDRYPVRSYQDLYETNRPEYQKILDYCKANTKKPNCVNVLVANQRIFRYRNSR